MANIAQTINVLQSVALTDGEDMILTPTYYVFRMFKDHQENTLLGSHITTPTLESEKKQTFPQLIESASENEDGSVVATVVNASPADSAEVLLTVADRAVNGIEAEILCGDPHDHNSFEDKNAVSSRPFDGFEKLENGLLTTLTPCSVTKFTLR